jgi:hypothetical protein
MRGEPLPKNIIGMLEFASIFFTRKLMSNYTGTLVPAAASKAWEEGA